MAFAAKNNPQKRDILHYFHTVKSDRSVADQEMRSSRNAGTPYVIQDLSVADQEMRSSRNAMIALQKTLMERSRSGNAL